MSASQYMARLQMNNGASFYFAKWETDSGHVPTVIQMIQQPLRTPGVDGIRYLDDHREPQLFRASTWEDFPSWAAAVNQAANYELVRSLYGSLLVSNNGLTQNFGLIKVVDVSSTDGAKPHPRAGALVGFGASNPSAAWLEAVWTMHVVPQ